MTRRALLKSLLALSAWPLGPAQAAGAAMRFPRDFGAHRDARTEWWYITGHAGQQGRQYGFQITFFRSRVPAAQSMESRFAARQLLFAHAAVTDLAGGRLLHDQRIARWSGLPQSEDGFGQAFAADADTDIRLGTGPAAWSLQRAGEAYRARARADEFALDLELTPSQPLLLQGDAGLSQKGPRPEETSRYYSVPQLRTRGELAIAGRRVALDAPDPTGNAAWLDHEWSDQIMPAEAVGWDWLGINGFDGFALTAFRLRKPDGTALWAGGSWRASGNAAVRAFAPGEVAFAALRRWTSPRTGVSYPVEWRLATPAGKFTLHALLDDQELDSRASTGAVYWEGLAELRDAQGKAVGRGYLELTGYQSPLRL